MIEVKSSGIACKDNLTKDYDMIPNSLFHYVELELISVKDFFSLSVLIL